jgi:hypothetical protein
MDESFWREQEGRLAGRMGQPCCTLAAMANLLGHMRGDFAVIVHGEKDCLNSFLHYEGGSASRFYCTRISQWQFAAGKTDEPLRRCLGSLIRLRSPQAVFVLGTCLAEMTSAGFEAVAQEAWDRTGTPVLALRTSGLKASSQGETLDWLFSSLARLPASAGGKLRRRINLIGLPRLQGQAQDELADVLRAAGLEVNGSYPLDASLDDWRRITRAGAHLVVDRGLYPRLLALLADKGSPVIEVPMPVGLRATLGFCDALARSFPRAGNLRRALGPRAAQAARRIRDFRRKFGRLRLALGIRMVNDYRADQLAYDGLGDTALFSEAGFDVTLFIQGSPDERSRSRFQARLEHHGCRLPFTVFPDPRELPALLKAGKFDLAYLADHARAEARQAGIPMIQSRSMAPFLSGVGGNLDYLERTITEKT